MLFSACQRVGVAARSQKTSLLSTGTDCSLLSQSSIQWWGQGEGGHTGPACSQSETRTLTKRDGPSGSGREIFSWAGLGRVMTIRCSMSLPRPLYYGSAYHASFQCKHRKGISPPVVVSPSHSLCFQSRSLLELSFEAKSSGRVAPDYAESKCPTYSIIQLWGVTKAFVMNAGTLL